MAAQRRPRTQIVSRVAPVERIRSTGVAQPEEVRVIQSIESELRQRVAIQTIARNSISNPLIYRLFPPTLDSHELNCDSCPPDQQLLVTPAHCRIEKAKLVSRVLGDLSLGVGGLRMNELVVKAILKVVIGGAVLAVLHFLCMRFARAPLVQAGTTVYSANRGMKYFLLFSGIALPALFFCFFIFIAFRDGIQSGSTCFFACFTLTFAFLFFFGIKEISATYEVQENRLSVVSGRKRTTYELSNLEIIREIGGGLVLRDPWGSDFLVSSFVEGYAELKAHILVHVRDER